MNTKSLFKNFRDDVEIILRDFFSSEVQKFALLSPFFKHFVNVLEEYTLRGGKRIRPAVMYFTHKLFNKNNDNSVINLSIFLEFIQSFLLIHDDIMDKSLKRRGGETVHKLYETYAKDNKIKDYEHFGRTMAILLGDLACQFGFLVVNKSKVSSEAKVKISEMINLELVDIVHGQANDVLLGYSKQYSYKDIIDIHFYKTAKYTFELPVLSACAISDADDKTVNTLINYSKYAGIAYQIKDDILGVFGQDDITGKDNTSDITENKKTLLILKAYENADQTQKKQLDSILGKEKISEKELEAFKKIIVDTGSLKFSEDECLQFIKKAKKELESLEVDDNNTGYDFLDFITEYILQRNF